MTLSPAVFELHVAAFDVAGLAKTLAEGGGHMRIFPGRGGVEEPDHRQRRLRARREWPCCRLIKGYGATVVPLRAAQ